MTTDSGLAYLSGLLRAGAEPLSPSARAARRRGDSPPHAARVSDHPAEDDTGQAAHAAPVRAGERDALAGSVPPEGIQEAVALNSSEVAGNRHTPSPDVPPGEGAAKSLSDDPNDFARGVERQVHARMQSRAVPPSSMGVRAASVMNNESHTPAASPTTGGAGEARTPPADDSHRPRLRADEIREGETERTDAVTAQTPAAAGERELIPVTRRHLDVGRPPATLHEEPNDAAVVTQSETAAAVEGSARRTSKAKTADEAMQTRDEALKDADEESAARGATFVVPGASLVRGSSAGRDPSARASQASREEGAQTFAGERARTSEGGAEPAGASAESAGASAEPAADYAPFTLEAHVEHLRALMRTARAETAVEDDAPGAGRLPAVAASHRTPPLNTAAREQPRTTPRTEFEARPETPTPAAKSGELQPAVLSNQEPHGASQGRAASATEARPTTPRGAWAQPGGVSPARARGEETAPARSASVRTAGAHSVTPVPAPAVAPTAARVGPAPSREGGNTGEGGGRAGGRAPKLTIKRLDVQVVGRREQPPQSPPPQPAPASPPHAADPWGALDRQLLGRFSY